MKILFVASELTPIAKVGGLGDVIGALPKALAGIGVRAEIVIPFYESINRRRWKPKKVFTLDTATSVYQTKLPGSRVPVFLIANKQYLGTGPIYFEKTPFVGTTREIERFTFFSKAVAELIAQGFFKPDVVHCNDWHTGALAALLAQMNADKTPSLALTASRGGLINADTSKSNLRRSASHPRKSALPPKVVFTIHNLANQGTAGGENLMAEGIRAADRITTVSPTYAREILTKEYGEGLDALLRSRKKYLLGILNGIDYDFWNPAHDAFLFKKYSKTGARAGKAVNKKNLLQSLKLSAGGAPLFGLVARLTPQKGIDFIIDTIESFLKKHDARFVFLGQGTSAYEAALTKIAQKFPDRVAVRLGFDEKLAHRIYAAADFFLMPSRFEPSGLGQMIAMRYGALPIVRETGGLKDTVHDEETGFVFRKPSSRDFEHTLIRAWNTYIHTPVRFNTIQRRCLRVNFDFRKSARAYRTLYQKIM